jgi:soluble lytic murein transglycosylase
VKRLVLLVPAVALAFTATYVARAQERATAGATGEGPRLAPTAHPAIPAETSQFWLVPDAAARAAAGRDGNVTRLVRGVRLIADGQFAAGLPLVRGARLDSSPLAAYAQYYEAIALIGLDRPEEAETILEALDKRDPDGYLDEAVPMQLADVELSRGEAKDAVDVLDDLSDEKLSDPEEVFLRLGRAAEAAGDRDRALKAYRKVYYDFPLSMQASDAQSGIERLETASLVASDRFKQQLARAERLFSARRWAQARAAFEPLARAASGNDRELVAIRLAECDYYLDRHRAAREALGPFLDGGSREAEARFFHLTATRALGQLDAYVALARKLVADHPDTEWAPETLNNLASHYIIVDDDAAADAVFRELYRRYPKSRHAERAAWKSGWWAYRNGDYLVAAQMFEDAAAAYPRADNRPAWLYWAGRSRDRLNDPVNASARYRIVVADYQNSYYGRLASKLLEARREPPVQTMVVVDRTVTTGATTLANDAVVRALAAAGLYDDALKEVQYARRIWGDSSVLQATHAWLRHQQGLELKATDRFNALRGAINTMRRAYPQFMAAGGEETLPPDLLRIIFPLDYWPLIKKYSDAHRLDPYLVAALMAQESTFTAEIRSSANAYGLMQLIPSTARRYARKVGIKRFSTSSLTNPETNVRLGTQYFKDLIDRFGGAHYALASYNAGENRVAQWRGEWGDLAQDEFIDNIPFPETQTYVKRILGTAEDYRRLYGSGVLAPATMRPGTTRRTD